jgi:hypothetical protein
MEDLMKIIRFLPALLLMVAWISLASSVEATTWNTPTIDGSITINASDWDADENMGDSGGTSGRDLYVTWDEDNLYVGVTGAGSAAVDIYIDTAIGGQQTGVIPGNFQIAGGSGGYEFLWRTNAAGTRSWFDGRGVNWVGPNSEPGASVRAADLEVSIPFSALIDYTPGNTISLLVLSGANPGSPAYYWPDESGNTITPGPSFTQAFIYEDAGLDNIVPGNSPTAVSLANISITNSGLSSLWLGLGLLILLTLAVFWRQVRSAKIRSL